MLTCQSMAAFVNKCDDSSCQLCAVTAIGKPPMKTIAEAATICHKLSSRRSNAIQDKGITFKIRFASTCSSLESDGGPRRRIRLIVYLLGGKRWLCHVNNGTVNLNLNFSMPSVNRCPKGNERREPVGGTRWCPGVIAKFRLCNR